jgi:DNA-binding MarR family transcriptional regulator
VEQPSDADRDLVDALFVASRALVGVAARSFADIEDITLPQYRALVLISTRARTTVSDLAEALDIHSTSATRLCDRLVRKRLLRRAESASDRRKTELHVAAPGRRMVERVNARRRAELARIAARMASSDATAAAQALAAFAMAAGDSGDRIDLFGWEPIAE